MVQTIKKLFRKSDDIYQGLLSYRSTPLPWCNLSPAELLMGRQLRTLLPSTDKQLIPQWNYLPEFMSANLRFKDKQKSEYDRHHRTTEAAPIQQGSEVWVMSGHEAIRGTVLTAAPAPRSYLIDTQSGIIRRNQQHLRSVPSAPKLTSSKDHHQRPTDTQSRGVTRNSARITCFQTGTEIVPPQRYQT